MKKQFGRSMIEMLGVLAIVGVLSIGGIALYRRAVNNHHANVILDDANRLAFVITEKGNFAPNDNIVGIEFNQTSTYSLVPFVGEKSGQYGIMVENVPKGVCELLVDKASAQYKVRVAAYGAIEYLDQDTTTGLVYDSFHKDICVNDMNDVILYFGDTSAQCNKPEEGETHAKCNSNADCCGNYFCAFENPIVDTETNTIKDKGEGRCRDIDYFEVQTSNVQTWVRSKKVMTWWSAENWCTALGKKMATKVDLGCGNCVGNKVFCTTKECQTGLERGGIYYAYVGSVLRKLQDDWKTSSIHWAGRATNASYGTAVYFRESNFYGSLMSDPHFALCH